MTEFGYSNKDEAENEGELESVWAQAPIDVAGIKSLSPEEEPTLEHLEEVFAVSGDEKLSLIGGLTDYTDQTGLLTHMMGQTIERAGGNDEISFFDLEEQVDEACMSLAIVYDELTRDPKDEVQDVALTVIHNLLVEEFKDRYFYLMQVTDYDTRIKKVKKKQVSKLVIDVFSEDASDMRSDLMRGYRNILMNQLMRVIDIANEVADRELAIEDRRKINLILSQQAEILGLLKNQQQGE